MSSESFKILDESQHLVLGYEWETALVIFKGSGHRLEISEHYGDPSCGVISPDESWVAVGGDGVTVLEFDRGKTSFFRQGTLPHMSGLLDAESLLIGVQGMKPISSDMVKVLLDPWSTYASTWLINIRYLTVEKLCDGPLLIGEPYREIVDF